MPSRLPAYPLRGGLLRVVLVTSGGPIRRASDVHSPSLVVPSPVSPTGERAPGDLCCATHDSPCSSCGLRCEIPFTEKRKKSRVAGPHCETADAILCPLWFLAGAERMIRASRTRTTFIHDLQSGNGQAAWRELCALYQPMLKAVALQAGLRPDDADDVTQDTLLAVFGGLKEGKYERDRGRLRNWIRGVLANRIREQYRRHKRLRSQSLDESVACSHDLPDAALDRVWEAALLKTVLGLVRAEVSRVTYEAFRRYALEGESASEVAEQLELSVNTVYIAKSRVMNRLRELYEEFGEPA